MTAPEMISELKFIPGEHECDTAVSDFRSTAHAVGSPGLFMVSVELRNGVAAGEGFEQITEYVVLRVALTTAQPAWEIDAEFLAPDAVDGGRELLLSARKAAAAFVDRLAVQEPSPWRERVEEVAEAIRRT